MKFRHEIKHQINLSDAITLKMRLSAVMKRDVNAVNGIYTVRSIYFDNLYDKALKEKIDGVNKREKFRIRLYNGDTSRINLEKKSKFNGLCLKESCPITKEECERIINGDCSWITTCDRPLLKELNSKMITQGLKAKTIVEYSREAFVYPAGNVRVTIDSNIQTGLNSTDFLNPTPLTITAGEPTIILEVKWDEYLPDIIKDAVTINGRRAGAYSKYANCRIYG